tara:strand:- start:4 stop:1026 length:1023 start_codon:yes stop_codon:yes gene_type:complete
MAFYTKVDYSRQLRQSIDTSASFSGSTTFEQDVFVGRNLVLHEYLMSHKESWLDYGDCDCGDCTTAHTFVVGSYSATSGSCNVTITPFSGVSGNSVVLSVGQVPMNPITGGTANPGITASTLQIANSGLLPYGSNSSSAIDLQLDEDGNVVRGNSSSKRYKTDIENVPENRYNKLLTISPKFFTYIETGRKGFGLIAEELDRLGYKELVIYNRNGQPENIEYKLLSVALIDVIKNISNSGNIVVTQDEPEIVTKVIGGDYITNGEYLIVSSDTCKVTLDSNKNKKIKLKSLTGLEILPDKGLIDGKWESISLDGDSSVELVFVDVLGYWVITSSDGLKNS